MPLPTHKTVFSGIQPSGVLHIGNYLGAIKQWVALQENNIAYFCIVDEHAITVPYDPQQLLSRVLDVAALYVASGLDPARSSIFVQSHLPEHTELAWLLSTVTPFGELTRMTQFKDKSRKQNDGTSAALFNYPLLMAADILLYQADLVPVGNDQTQHVELTRAIAERFNRRFGEVFTLPKPHINADSARIMSLTDPTRKMSKSDDAKSYIALTDEPHVIAQKIRGAVTETEPVFSFTQSGLAVKNLLHIYQAFSEESTDTIEQKFSGKGYKDFKEALAELLTTHLTPLQNRFKEIRSDEKSLQALLTQGQKKASAIATKTLVSVKTKMGLQ